VFDVNEYFDGRVKSMAFQTKTLPATVGVMAPGDYEFGTSEKETMTVVSGSLKVLLPDEEEWRIFKPNQSFIVAAGLSFNVEVEVDTAYLCTYG
jgi:purine/pyrimidine-nucleoside phosphorylase